MTNPTTFVFDSTNAPQARSAARGAAGTTDTQEGLLSLMQNAYARLTLSKRMEFFNFLANPARLITPEGRTAVEVSENGNLLRNETGRIFLAAANEDLSAYGAREITNEMYYIPNVSSFYDEDVLAKTLFLVIPLKIERISEDEGEDEDEDEDEESEDES